MPADGPALAGEPAHPTQGMTVGDLDKIVKTNVHRASPPPSTVYDLQSLFHATLDQDFFKSLSLSAVNLKKAAAVVITTNLQLEVGTRTEPLLHVFVKDPI